MVASQRLIFTGKTTVVPAHLTDIHFSLKFFRAGAEAIDMSTSANAAPLPPEGNNQPNLSVVPPVPAPPRKPYALSRADEQEIAKAQLLVTVASAPAYVALLTSFGVTTAFLTTLQNDLNVARQCSERAFQCTNAKKGATASEGSR